MQDGTGIGETVKAVSTIVPARGTNLFNPNDPDIIPNAKLDTSKPNGTLSNCMLASNSYFISGKIPCKYGDTLTCYPEAVYEYGAFEGSDESFQGAAYTTNSISAPVFANVTYIRITLPNSWLTNPDAYILVNESVYRPTPTVWTGYHSKYNNISPMGLVGDGETDNTEALKALLKTEKHIAFGVGKYVLGNITLTDEVTIEGKGSGTELIFKEGLSGNLFTVRSNNVTIKDCKIIGSYQAVKGNAVGDRVGISINGYQSLRMLNVQCQGFSKAGIYAAGLGLQNDGGDGVRIDLCNFQRCYYGIFLDVRAEFSKISNTVCTRNYIGCAVCGGNNMIMNCTFIMNTHGYFALGGENNGHYALTNCQFVHNSLTSFKASDITVGLTLTGCVFCDAIVIENSKGIMIQNSEMTQTSLLVKGGGWNCLRNNYFFNAMKILSMTDVTLLENNYTCDGTLYTYPPQNTASK